MPHLRESLHAKYHGILDTKLITLRYTNQQQKLWKT